MKKNIFSLSDKDVHFWHFVLTSCPADLINQYAKILSNEEIEKRNHFAFNSLKNLFEQSHILLRLILSKYIGCDPQKIDYIYNDYGKPFLKYNPTNIQFNMSHSNEFITFGIRKDVAIGVDIEQIKHIHFSEEMFDSVLTCREKKILKKKTDIEKNLLFLKAWTCKEAFVKAVGHGLSFPLLDIELLLDSFPPKLFSIQNSTNLANDWSLFCFEKKEKFTSAMVTKKTNDLHFRFISPKETLSLLDLSHKNEPASN